MTFYRETYRIGAQTRSRVFLTGWRGHIHTLCDFRSDVHTP